jgi:hypothetical protein
MKIIIFASAIMLSSPSSRVPGAIASERGRGCRGTIVLHRVAVDTAMKVSHAVVNVKEQNGIVWAKKPWGVGSNAGITTIIALTNAQIILQANYLLKQSQDSLIKGSICVETNHFRARRRVNLIF